MTEELTELIRQWRLEARKYGNWSTFADLSDAEATHYAATAAMYYAAAMDADHFGNIESPELGFDDFAAMMD